VLDIASKDREPALQKQIPGKNIEIIFQEMELV
jgi:hypothetical protein